MQMPPAQIHVVFALLPGSLVLDWAGPAEALRIANQVLLAQGQPARFALHFVSPSPQSATSVGVVLTGLAPLPATLPTPAWVVLVGLPGQRIDVDHDDAHALLHWLRGLRLASGRLELVTVCAGAVLAAHAGLLAGRRATTHHQHLDELTAVEPRCDVVSNRVFVADGPLHSSAGVTTGIDLVLQRIADTCSPAVAAQVAQTMVVALRRGPHDPELSPFLSHRNHLHAALHRVQDAVGPATRAWVAGAAQGAQISASVCTGAFILAAAGVLTQGPVTTHWEDLADLRARFPHLTVRENVRWVDQGARVTSAGISAGIDMCLHLVARLAGLPLAERTAHQMEWSAATPP